MGKRPVRLASVMIALTLVAAACGARVNEQQLATVGGGGLGAAGVPGGVAADGDGVGGSGTSSADAGFAAGDGGAGGTAGDTSTVDGSTDGSPTPGAAGGGGGGGGDGGAGDQAAPAPEGGNGGATDVGVTADTMVLGNVSTLSGPVPGLFQGAVIGTQAVVAYQNSKGGLFGRRFMLEVRDDQFDTGQNRAQTLDLLDRVFAFVGSFSLYESAAATEIQKSGIVDATYALDAPRRDLPNNYSPSPGADGAPTSIFNYWKAKFPEAIKAVGTVYGDIPAAKASHVNYKRAAQSVGWNYVYERGYQATETDFTADVIRMRQSGVKLVFLIAVDDKTIARVAKAMQQQNFEPEAFITNGSGYSANIVALGGDAVDGLYNAQPYAMFLGEDAFIPEVKLLGEWVDRVKPGARPDLFAMYGWASGRLFFQALEAAGPQATRADVLRELAEIDDFSSNDLLGPGGPGSKRPTTCYVYMQLTGGTWKRLDPPPPTYRCNDGEWLLNR